MTQPLLFAALVPGAGIAVPCPDEAIALQIADLGNEIAQLRPDLVREERRDAKGYVEQNARDDRGKHEWIVGPWPHSTEEHAFGLPGTLFFWMQMVARRNELGAP